MEDCVNKNLDYINRKYLNEINDIALDEEVGDYLIENENVIHIDVTENEPETNWDTLKKVIEQLPDDQDDEQKEKSRE